MSDRVYIGMPDVVERYAGVWSRWSLYEMVRRQPSEIPHRKPAGRRELIFPIDELEAWEDGAALETFHGPDGGRVCRPRAVA